MKLKRLLALLMALGLVASACGSSDSSDGASDDTESTDTTEAMEDEETTTSAAPEDAGEAAAEIATDFGVTEDTIKVGLNADLSGPFASLVAEIVEGQTVYWEVVNANGGIAGRQVEMVVLDSGYATAKGIENYLALAAETDEGVAMISEHTGSPMWRAAMPWGRPG